MVISIGCSQEMDRDWLCFALVYLIEYRIAACGWGEGVCCTEEVLSSASTVKPPY